MEQKDTQSLYQAFKSKDSRFDGRFFIGVKSTGIYCRPICRAKMPKEENCTYYLNAAEAEQAGFRPCLLCRPELAPGNAITEMNGQLARKAARRLEESNGSGQSIVEIAKELGCSERHLRRVFLTEFKVTPSQYLQTSRLLLAKNLLTDTKLSVIEVAMASGFGSLRRFNDSFKKQYQLTPTALRKEVEDHENSRDQITLSIGYRPPYLWAELLNFLNEQIIPGVEVINGGIYSRTVQLEDEKQNSYQGWIQVSNHAERNELFVTIDLKLLPVLPQLLAKIRNLFDIDCNPVAIYERLQHLNEVYPDLCQFGIRLPGCFDSFEIAVSSILKQQSILKELVEKLGKPIQTNIPELTHIFPTAEQLSSFDESIITQQGKSIQKLANMILGKDLELHYYADMKKEISKLVQEMELEEETAKYIVVRTMHCTDEVWITSSEGKEMLQLSEKQTQELMESCSPWSSYAVINIWNYLRKERELK